MNKCLNCGKDTNNHQNFCNWDCSIEYTKKHGGKINTPNNLPIASIRYDGMMLECEHGDHQDYKFPVTVEWVGPIGIAALTSNCPHCEDKCCICEECAISEALEHGDQTHAFIYTDANIALTIYECNYAIWKLPDGKVVLSDYHDETWKLTDKSVKEIIKWYDQNVKIKLD